MITSIFEARSQGGSGARAYNIKVTFWCLVSAMKAVKNLVAALSV